MAISRVDESTLQELAIWIGEHCSGSELRGFFSRAGFKVPSHDGTTKWRWALDLLDGINSHDGQVEKIILRLVNPREYPGQPSAVNTALNRMNGLLSLEGYEVFLDGVVPSVRCVDPYIASDDQPVAFVAVDPPEFSSFIHDTTLEEILKNRWEEAQTAVHAKCYLSAVIMMGSILETCLLSAVTSNMREANQSQSAPQTAQGKPKLFREWSLSDLITVAHDCEWIQPDTKDFSHALREYRNMVHPMKQKEKAFNPDVDTCAICWEVVKATINDLVSTFDTSSS